MPRPDRQSWGADWQSWSRWQWWSWEADSASDWPWEADSASDWPAWQAGGWQSSAWQSHDRSRPGAASVSSWPRGARAPLPVIIDTWDHYDRDMLEDFVPKGVEGQVDTKPSRRIGNLGKAFQNYRRTILYHLKLWRFGKELFWGWRRCCANFDGAAIFAQQVWTDDNMEAFVKTWCRSKLRSNPAI